MREFNNLERPLCVHLDAQRSKHHREDRDEAQQVIAHAAWLYYRPPLSLPLIEGMLLKLGIVVSEKTMITIRRRPG